MSRYIKVYYIFSSHILASCHICIFIIETLVAYLWEISLVALFGCGQDKTSLSQKSRVPHFWDELAFDFK